MSKIKDRVYEEKTFWSKFAPWYDKFMSIQIKSYDTLIDKILREIEMGQVVLEVAAGTGLVTMEIARKASKVHAIDITPEMISQAFQKAKSRNIKNIDFSVEDAYALPFGDNMFDVAVCSNALHNMKKPENALLEMKRVLKSGGKVITATFCHGEGLKSRIISNLITIVGFPGYQKFTGKKLSELIAGSGFGIEKNEVIKEHIPMAFITGKAEK